MPTSTWGLMCHLCHQLFFFLGASVCVPPLPPHPRPPDIPAAPETEVQLLEALRYCCQLGGRGQAPVWLDTDSAVRRWVREELFEEERAGESRSWALGRGLEAWRARFSSNPRPDREGSREKGGWRDDLSSKEGQKRVEGSSFQKGSLELKGSWRGGRG